MADQGEQYEMSWILHHILDRFIGSPEMVESRRRQLLQCELIQNGRKKGLGSIIRTFYTGSGAEGIRLEGSDLDSMTICNNVIVLCPFQDSSIPQESKDKTVFIMRDADSRPGYVNLELVNVVPTCNEEIGQSIVRDRNAFFISSEMYRRNLADTLSKFTNSFADTHGPAVTLTNFTNDINLVYSFPCTRWPREAYEWVSRPRLHSWPDKSLRDEIVHGGCHLVPVGNRASADPFLQWQISFTTAERKLIHSLTRTQFLIYGLLKYFLKQISDRLEQIFGDEDILSSYIIKTVMLYAVESTPGSFWQEKNTFFCFVLCLKILITWVNAGYCPNYFISINNMFCGKVQGENQQKLLRILIELYDMKWECLSVGTVIQPPLGIRMQMVRNGAWELVLRPPTESERRCDMQIFSTAVLLADSSDFFSGSLSLLSKAKLGIDEFLAYTTTLSALCCTGLHTFEKHIAAKGNKEKYKFLRKCKNLMTPLSSVCTSPGLLTLATYHYHTGNYIKTLEMCGVMLSSFTIYFHYYWNHKEIDIYENLYCGRGYTLLHKCQEVCVSNVQFPPTAPKFCPSQLHPELKTIVLEDELFIPPLPYAVFLTFLCYHELGDKRRRAASLLHLRAVKYNEKQGVGHHWIVHNLLGICYELVGDTRRALREYRDSLGSQTPRQYYNPAKERIERLQNSQ